MSKEVEVVVEIPKTDLQPQNGRILVIGVSAEDVKTHAGIIIPTNFTEMKGDDKLEWEFRRYFVIAVAKDVQLTVKVGDKAPRQIKRGDEIQPFFHSDALKVEYPQVIDWDNGGEKLTMLHESEIAVVNGKVPEMESNEE